MNKKFLGKFLGYQETLKTNGSIGDIVGGTASPSRDHSMHADSTRDNVSAKVAEMVFLLNEKEDCLVDKPVHFAVGASNDAKTTSAEYRDANSFEVAIVVENRHGYNVYSSGIGAKDRLEQLRLDTPEANGMAILLALHPFLMKDAEYEARFDACSSFINNGDVTRMDNFLDDLAVLSGNVYWRLAKDEIFTIHPDASGYFKPSMVNCHNMKAYSCNPAWSVGEFVFLNGGGGAVTNAGSDSVEDFLKGVVISEDLTEEEKALVPVIDKFVVVPNEVKTACQLYEATRESNRPFNNFLFKGPAGSGKSTSGQLMAAKLGRPFTRETCFANMEFIDFSGTYVPNAGGNSNEREKIKADLENIPSAGDILFMPAMAYTQLTGEEAPLGVTSEEVFNLADEKRKDLEAALLSDSSTSSFTYVPSEFVKAVRYGWVCEVQEPTVIANPGVLPGLNSILEGGTLTLPTGEVIHRHPDCVIIFTTNVDYEGCRPMNESVEDRFPVKFYMETPGKRELIKRVSKITGCKDKNLIGLCYDTLVQAQAHLASFGYSTGKLGSRVLYDWVTTTMILKDATEAAKITLCQATDDPDIKDEILQIVNSANIMVI